MGAHWTWAAGPGIRRTLRWAFALLALAVALPATAAASANNDYGSAAGLSLYNPPSGNNSGDTIQASEPLTANDGTNGCNPDNTTGNRVSGGSKTGATVWFSVVGTGHPMVVWTTPSADAGSTQVDSVLAAYNTSGTPTGANFITCNDDFDFDPTVVDRQSAIFLNTVEGATYLIQVGGYAGTSGASPATGPFTLNAYAGPDNDDQVAAATLGPDQTLGAQDNRGATSEGGETTACTAGFPQFGRTVWYQVTLPAPASRWTVATGGSTDTVMAVYNSAGTQLGCNDDGDPMVFGPSTVSLTNLPAGQYLVQVGGWHPGGGGDALSASGGFSISSSFVENFDVDGDGSSRPADCNDDNASIHPGANDIAHDNIDQNCDGHDNLDGDGDGVSTPQDCNDGNASIHPGAVDSPGNGVDEDCNGSDAPVLDRDHDGYNTPQDCNDNNPAVHPGATEIRGDNIDQDCVAGNEAPTLLKWTYSYFLTPAGKVTTLTVKTAKGATVKVTCSGRHCPRSTSRKSKGKPMKLASLFHRALGSGATITVRATQVGFYGREARITYLRGKPPRKREACLSPDKRAKRTKCP